MRSSGRVHRPRGTRPRRPRGRHGGEAAVRFDRRTRRTRGEPGAEPLFPAPRRRGRPSRRTRRQLIDGNGWRVRVGAPWRDVLTSHDSWQAVHVLVRRWRRDGAWTHPGHAGLAWSGLA
ncbi:transposase [Streptomyces sp. NPDC051597]|uniref:transposase n=1 Tax=Streptomyces sp. NPDC051597 TaxID=3155049 RepID=UPI0034306C83